MPVISKEHAVELLTREVEENQKDFDLTNTEIGTELYLSLSTVKTHLAAVQAKIGARNRVEVAAWAWEHRRAGPP